MGLTDLFSKLIVEHGSAEVQAKHIALFKDQLAMAEKKTALLESENTILKTENEKLKSDFKESQKENEILRSKIQKYEQPTEQTTHDNPLEETKSRILYWLSKNKMTSEQVATTLQIGNEVAKFHLSELKTAKMVSSQTRFDAPLIWQLAQEGRRYLIVNNIIA